MRPGKYSNPFVIGRDGDRDVVCDRFEKEILPYLDVEPLQGKDLICCCKPKRCHCDSILIKANRPKENKLSSLHVKYRPSKWVDVLGQDATIKALKKVVADKRAKSFIFGGPSGTGKTTLARILANEFAGGEATAANIDEVDAATHTGVESMREIAARAHYRAVGASSVKAILVDEAHRLSGAAWDALLKPIEEPPAHVYWMFCSTNPGKIPKTIQTRCLTFNLNLLTEEQIAEVLIRVIDAEKFDVSDGIIEAISENSGGSPRQALVFLEECLYCETVGEAKRVMRTAGQSKEVVDLCRMLIKGRGVQWTDITRTIKAMEGADAESIRIIICNYFAKALLDANSNDAALRLMAILDCFSQPYQPSDKEAPLLLSLGQAIGIGGGGMD